MRNARAGKMRFRVDLQRVTQTVDSVGQPQEAWATLATVWANIETPNPIGAGREFTVADALAADVTTSVVMRYVVKLTPKDRIVYGTREFEIISLVNTDERNRILTAYCREKV